MSWKRVVTVGLGLLCLAAAARAGDWPQFRGPGGAGVSDEKQLPAEWSAESSAPRARGNRVGVGDERKLTRSK